MLGSDLPTSADLPHIPSVCVPLSWCRVPYRSRSCIGLAGLGPSCRSFPHSVILLFNISYGTIMLISILGLCIVHLHVLHPRKIPVHRMSRLPFRLAIGFRDERVAYEYCTVPRTLGTVGQSCHIAQDTFPAYCRTDAMSRQADANMRLLECCWVPWTIVDGPMSLQAMFFTLASSLSLHRS